MKQSLIPRQTIISNLTVTLCVEQNPNQQTLTILRMKKSLFNSVTERFEIQMSLPYLGHILESKEVEMQSRQTVNVSSVDVEPIPFVPAIEMYILKRIKPDSNPLRDADLRFKKLKLAADILIFVKSGIGNIKDLYDRAFELQKQQINTLYPGGELGNLIIRIRAESDGQFAAKLQQDRAIEAEPAPVPIFI